MKNLTVLLLEDEPVIAADLIALLRSLGCEVLRAADGREAQALCALHLPDLAVLNFRQPNGTDGASLASALRADFPIQVFFVTGALRQDLETALGFNIEHTVLYKPFTKRQFKAVLTKMLP